MGLDFATAGIFTEHFELKVIPGILLTFLVLYISNKTVFTEKDLKIVEAVVQTFRTVEEELLQHHVPRRDYDNWILALYTIYNAFTTGRPYGKGTATRFRLNQRFV